MARSTVQLDASDIEVHAPTLMAYFNRYRSALKDGIWELYKSKTAFIGGIMLVFLIAACVLTPYIARYSPVK